MLLIMGIMLGCVFTFLEIMLVHGSSTIRQMYTHGVSLWIPFKGRVHVPSIWVNTIGSFALSFIVGAMFPAMGLTIFFGAIISTGLSQAYFSAETFAQQQGWSMTKIKQSIVDTTNAIGRTKRSIVQTKNSISNVWNDFRQPIKDVIAIFLAFLKIITFPLVMLRKASIAYSEYTERKATLQ